MTICASCGLQNVMGLCIHHTQAYHASWLADQYAWCNFIHRKIPPPVISGEYLGITRDEFIAKFEAAGGDPIAARLTWRQILDEETHALTVEQIETMVQVGRYVNWYGESVGGCG